jgi:hypothetical protein
MPIEDLRSILPSTADPGNDRGDAKNVNNAAAFLSAGKMEELDKSN